MPRKAKEQKTETKQIINKKRSRAFAVVLYPQEAANHAFLFNWLCQFEHIVWIEHNRDTYSDDIYEDEILIHSKGSLKKSHLHVLIIYDTPKSLDSIIKKFTEFYNHDLKPSEQLEHFHVEAISSISDYLLYMCHRTLIAQYEGKYQYSPQELNGDKKLIEQVYNGSLDDRSILFEIINFVKNKNLNYTRLVQAVCGDEVPSYWYNCVMKNQATFRQVCNDNKFDK